MAKRKSSLDAEAPVVVADETEQTESVQEVSKQEYEPEEKPVEVEKKPTLQTKNNRTKICVI